MSVVFDWIYAAFEALSYYLLYLPVRAFYIDVLWVNNKRPDICAGLTNVPSAHWNLSQNVAECEDLIERNVYKYYYGALIISYWLWLITLFCTLTCRCFLIAPIFRYLRDPITPIKNWNERRRRALAVESETPDRREIN